MMKKYLTYIAFTFWIALVFACAQPSAPKGGPKDTQPPRLHSKKYSTPNKMTNFDYEEVILTFDEWVKLQNAYAEVVVSPPLKGKPVLKVKHKSVVLRFNEPLKDSTTYVIQYGKAIRDITESNAADMTFVFTTGDELDSLKIKGRVTDYLTGKPLNDVLVMLYRSMDDSMPIKEKPYYFDRSDKTGNFEISYIRGGQYRLFALKDANSNYKFDQAQEMIDFEPAFVIDDSTKDFSIRLFENKRALKVLSKKETGFGQGFVAFNQPLEEHGLPLYDLSFGGNTAALQVQLKADTLFYWFNKEGVDFSLLYEKGVVLDTVKHEDTKLADYLEESPSVGLKLSGKLTEGVGFGFKMACPVAAVDTNLIEIWRDEKYEVLDDSAVSVKRDTSIVIKGMRVLEDTTNVCGRYLSAGWVADQKYRLTFLPGAVTDIYGRVNKDTLEKKITVAAPVVHGTVKVELKEMAEGMVYFVQLVNGKGAVVVQKAIMKDSVVKFDQVILGNYQVRIFVDKNQNSRWDSGDYINGKKPEPMVLGEMFKMKEGWEQIEEINVKE